MKERKYTPAKLATEREFFCLTRQMFFDLMDCPPELQATTLWRICHHLFLAEEEPVTEDKLTNHVARDIIKDAQTRLIAYLNGKHNQNQRCKKDIESTGSDPLLTPTADTHGYEPTADTLPF